MFLLDTDILSAIMSSRPAQEEAAWIEGQPIDEPFTTSISQAEILRGFAIMRETHRRRDLEAAARAMFMEDFENRVQPFDQDAAAAYADIFAACRRAGRPAAALDLMIASTARSRGASVVTRDMRGFEGNGVTVINPWDIA